MGELIPLETATRPEVEGRVPPHDLRAEGAVLSAAMTDADALPAVSDFLEPQHFYSEAHRRIFEAIVAVGRSTKLPDPTLVMGWLQDHDRLAQVGGVAYVTEVLNAAPETANIRRYGERVHAMWRLRQLVLMAQRLIAQGYAGVSDPQAFLEGAAQAVHEISYDATDVGALAPLGEALEKIVAEIEAAEKDRRSLLGMPTGLTRFDRCIGGLRDGGLTVVAARPGRGKSAMVLGAAVCIARESGPVAFFSLEMTREELALRAACSEAMVDVKSATTGSLSANDWKRLAPVRAEIARLPLFIDDTPAITTASLRARLRRLQRERERKAKKGAPRLRLVVVDYLQLLHASSKAQKQNREREVAEIAQDLKEIAKEFQVHVLACSQMNRDIENSERRPRLRDLRESGNIEQAADNIVFLHQDRKAEEKNVVELCIEKQRNGPPDVIRVHFEARFTRFNNLAEGEYDDGPDEGPLAAPHATECRCAKCRAPR